MQWEPEIFIAIKYYIVINALKKTAARTCLWWDKALKIIEDTLASTAAHLMLWHILRGSFQKNSFLDMWFQIKLQNEHFTLQSHTLMRYRLKFVSHWIRYELYEISYT